MLLLLALGFCSGLPSPLIFSNLSIWLSSEGVSRTDIGFFAFATTPLALNFLWAPLVDRLPIPWLTPRLGKRRSWALVCQVFLMLAVFAMAWSEPKTQLAWMAIAVVFLAFMSATLDVVLDAFRIELVSKSQQGAGAATYIYGWYLGGMLVGGAGGLYLADHLGWQAAYQILGLCVAIGMLAVFFSPEPSRPPDRETEEMELRAKEKIDRFSRLPESLRTLIHWLYVSVVAPFVDFTKKDAWFLILFFIFIFRLGDALLGRMSGVFYRELGFTLSQIAGVTKIYGLAGTLLGIFLGGILVARVGLLRALFLAGLCTALTNLTYSWLDLSDGHFQVFVLAVISDNFTSGLVTVAFVAYLSSLCNTAYTATQYALLASLGNLARIWFSAFSGWMVDFLNGAWALFFWITSVIALLGLPLLLILMKKFPMDAKASSSLDKS
jgi:PAT family beta-lactamase induction signal transducer AmpG